MVIIIIAMFWMTESLFTLVCKYNFFIHFPYTSKGHILPCRAIHYMMCQWDTKFTLYDMIDPIGIGTYMNGELHNFQTRR